MCKFVTDYDGLYTPTSPDPNYMQPAIQQPSKCRQHLLDYQFWCLDDELALCGDCRLLSHANHDVIPMADRHRQELNGFSSVVDRTLQLTNEMKSAGPQLKKRNDSLYSQYLEQDSQVRKSNGFVDCLFHFLTHILVQIERRFRDWFTELTARKHRAKQELFRLLKEKSNAIHSIERNLREAHRDIDNEMAKAQVNLHSPEATKSTVQRWTESLERFQFYQPVLAELAVQLNSTVDPIATVEEGEWAVAVRPLGIRPEEPDVWEEMAVKFAALKDEKNRAIVDAMNAASPIDPTEIKRQRRTDRSCPSGGDDDDILPVVTSQLKAGWSTIGAGSTLTACVMPYNPETSVEFYIQLANVFPEEIIRHLQARIQSHADKPVPRLDQLV